MTGVLLAPRARTLAAAALVACVGLLAFGASNAWASFGITKFDGSVLNQDGSGATQAGSHPWEASATIAFPTKTDSAGNLEPDGNVRDIQVELPAGLVGDPSTIPECAEDQFETFNFSTYTPDCPLESQVGTVAFTQATGGSTTTTLTLPVYNLVPPAGVPAEFGFLPFTTPIHARAIVRTGGDYGITIDARDVPQITALVGLTLTLWGVPADPSHDPDRGNFCEAFGGGTPFCANSGNPSKAKLEPFLTNPMDCAAGPLTTVARADSWQNPGTFLTASFLSHLPNGTPTGVTGCERVPSDPSITIQPDVTTADSPAGLSVDLHVPQNDAPNGVAEAELKSATVTLPQGVSVNPSAAGGLQACTPDEIGLNNASEPSCPDASKVGSVEIDTPLLPDPLKGGIFVAQQNNNPFGSLLAIYVTAEADGVLVKLAGHVAADPKTGQLTTTFSNNPQLPFTDFKLDFFGGPRAVLATPEACGTYTTNSSLSPWSGTAAATPSDSFTIDSGCVSGFNPTFTAGATNAQAGAYSPFALSFSRADTDQELSGLTVKLPTGLLAKLGSVQECTNAQLAAAASTSGTAQQANPSCPAGSQVGTVEVGAGPGSDPFFLPGKVYLTGPYKGGPYGLAVVVPALAGPYDLGTVVVRQALYVDPTTAQVTDVSDPFPTILQGIPLRIRRIDVDLNRPGFTVNPTSCDPTSVTGTLTSTQGTQAAVSSRFQVGGCQALGFSPRLRMALSGRGRTRSGDHPRLTATVTQRGGQANLKSVRVTLPLSMALDPKNSDHVCGYEAALSVHGGSVPCARRTIVGSATAVTPLLSEPLKGPVYLVQGIRFSHGQRIRTLPTLLIPLRGQIALDLRAKTSVNAGGALVTTFSTIPDAPVSRFTLNINGGRRGILVVTGRGRSICTGAQFADALMGAQSGKTHSQQVRITTPCGRSARLKVLSHRIHGGILALRVRSSERGRLTITGHGVRRVSRVIRAGTHRVRLHLARQVTRLSLQIILTPNNARPARRRLTVRM